jgi:CDP-glucose 4,6-dehydratase
MEHMAGTQAVGVSGSFWAGRRVFVTGHTGFFGGWLCAWLQRLGAEVVGYALAPATRPSFYDAVGVGAGMRSLIADVRDGERLRRAAAESRAEIVYHLAAQPLVRAAHAEPVETFATNVMGTVNLLEAVRSAPGVRAAIVVTTDKVYDNVEWHWGYREGDRLGGREPYGASKACAEIAVDAYRHAYFATAPRRVGMATVRAGNLIGGGDWSADRLIPDAIRAFSAGTRLTVRNPAAARPWQHVLDPVRGLLLLGERLLDAPARWDGAWNLGPAENEAHSVTRVVETVARLWGAGARWESGAASAQAPPESRLLSLSPMKALAELSWRPLWALERALSATVDWYRAHLAGDDMRAFTLGQITALEGTN